MAWREEAASEAHDTPSGEIPSPSTRVGRIGLEMAHELKNSLTAVKALVQLGLRNPAEAASHARLAVIERELGRMEELLHGFLSVASPGSTPDETTRARSAPSRSAIARGVAERAR